MFVYKHFSKVYGDDRNLVDLDDSSVLFSHTKIDRFVSSQKTDENHKATVDTTNVKMSQK